MTILMGAEADAEIDQAQGVSDVDVGTHDLPFTRLTADDFERLAYALFKVSAPVGETRNWTNASMLLRGKDAGRDVLLHDDQGVVGVVQCKRLETAISLPEVFREVAKTILMARLESDLKGGVPTTATYYLMLSSDPTGPVVDLSMNQLEVVQARAADVDAAVREVIERYKSLANVDQVEATALVHAALSSMRFKLLRPADLNQWLAEEAGVALRFFRAHMVIDNSALDPLLAKMDEIHRRTEYLPLLTDVDLKIIKERIEATPENQRLTIGFASLFGYPREMFVGDENLRRRMSRLATLLSELDTDYLFWMSTKAQEEAARITNLGEVSVRSHPFARQIPLAYLGNLAMSIVSKSLGGLFGKLNETTNGRSLGIENDADRLLYVRDHLFASGQRYLAGNFDDVFGEGEILELKRRIIRHIMNGIADEQTLTKVLDDGIAILKPHLDESAARLRALAAHNPSIFIMGMSGLDNADVVKQMSMTMRALTDANSDRQNET